MQSQGEDSWIFADDMEALGWQSTLEKSGIPCRRLRHEKGWKLEAQDPERAAELRHRISARQVERQNRAKLTTQQHSRKTLYLWLGVIVAIWLIALAVTPCRG